VTLNEHRANKVTQTAPKSLGKIAKTERKTRRRETVALPRGRDAGNHFNDLARVVSHEVSRMFSCELANRAAPLLTINLRAKNLSNYLKLRWFLPCVMVPHNQYGATMTDIIEQAFAAAVANARGEAKTLATTGYSQDAFDRVIGALCDLWQAAPDRAHGISERYVQWVNDRLWPRPLPAGVVPFRR